MLSKLRAQVNKFKTKEAPEKEKVKTNNEEPTKQQTVASQDKDSTTNEL
jgi:hypothetical protein